MNKNFVIAALAALLILGSIWGQIGNRSKKALQKELEMTVAQLEETKSQSSQEHDVILSKTAALQKTLQGREEELKKVRNALHEKGEQLKKARKELVGLRKGAKAMEVKVSECQAALQAMDQEKAALLAELDKLKQALDEQDGAGESADEQAVAALQAKLDEAQATIAELEKKVASLDESQPSGQGSVLSELETARAQIIGLEKIIEEKNATIEETGRELDHFRVNMDVLLSKIADQRDELQELREENRKLVQELAAKNEQIADLNEQLAEPPAKE